MSNTVTIDQVIEDVTRDIENPQFNIEIELRERYNPNRKRGRVYAHEWDQYYKTPRIFIHPKDETILENFFVGRRNRPYQMYRKHILPTVFEELGWDANTKVRWSMKAGCTFCPCSPGFIVTQRTIKDTWDLADVLRSKYSLPPRPAGLKNDYEPYDVFVTISPKGGDNA